MNGNPICQNRTPDNMAASTPQIVTDALAGVDHAQGNPGTFGLGPAHELAALRDLADAVRLAGAVPQLGTEHDGYTVRAVVEGQPAEGRLPHWYVAGEGPEGWASWTVVLEHGRLLWVMPHKLSMPEGLPIDRAAALRDLAERAQIAL